MAGRKKTYIGKKPHRMIVISWDAVGSRDLEFLETLPHFRDLPEGTKRMPEPNLSSSCHHCVWSFAGGPWNCE